MATKKTVTLDGSTLTIDDIINVAEKGYAVELGEGSRKKIIAGRRKLEKQLRERPDIAVYGTNRLHGDLKNIAVQNSLINSYQVKYIKVHNCGTGDPVPVEIVRAMMVIRLNSFAKGLSGMKLDTCQLLVDMLNKKVTPWVLEEGSVGASGDLVPLAMIGAVMIELDEAQAYFVRKDSNGEKELMPAKKALRKAGLKKIKLGAKEAMGLTNGSNFISAFAVFAVRDTERILRSASISAALSLEAIRGEQKAFSELINEGSDRHEGQIVIAKQIRKLIEGSKRCSRKAQEHKFGGKIKGEERVQDRYSFRCAPQVHGALYEAIDKMKKTLSKEINSATDNPLFQFDRTGEDGGVLFASGGNFHGQALAAPIDYLKITLTSLGLITDKRAFSLLDQRLSFGLPADLANDTSKADGGLMVLQYAGAARAAENRVLSTPASVMSVSTAANQEDYVSMGSVGVIHLRKIIYNTQILVGIELLCALRGLQLTYNKLPKGLRELGKGTQKVYNELSKPSHFPPEKTDRYLRTEMMRSIELVKSGKLIELVDGLLS
ncbi:MAG TPA: aromatic amino acid ammonia-lyase [Chitinophagaceae bacterium]|nr:aromatic amino acid ammonia-lyase [Chitinophagaceae bacterium]